jgi:hypothetical protein
VILVLVVTIDAVHADYFPAVFTERTEKDIMYQTLLGHPIFPQLIYFIAMLFLLLQQPQHPIIDDLFAFVVR